MEAVLNDSLFLEKLQTQKKDVYSELKEKLYKAKLTAVRDFLERKGIEVDYRITDLDKLKQTVKNNESIYSQVENFEKGFEKDLTDVIENLNAGSTNAFQMFCKTLKSVAKATLTGMAVETAGTLLSVDKRAIVGATLSAPRIYTGLKNLLKQKRETKENAVDVTLLNLARVDIEGESLRLEIPENVRKTVAEQLKDKNVNGEDTSLFLSSIIGLNMKDKINAIQLINSLTGNRFDVNYEINKNHKAISEMKKNSKKNAITQLRSGLVTALQLSSLIKDDRKDLTASTITGMGRMDLSGNVAISATKGLNKIGKWIPAIGLFIKELINENDQEIKEPNEELKEDILKRIEDAKRSTSEELNKRTNKQVILDIVCDELRINEVDIPYDLQDTYELKTILQAQPLNKKTRAANIAKNLKKIERSNDRTFKDKIKDYAKYAYYGGILTLAGLGTYNIFRPGFLERINLFNEKGLQEQSDERNENSKIETVLKMVGNIEAMEAAKNYLDRVQLADQPRNSYKAFGIGSVAKSIGNGIKNLFAKRTKNKVLELPEAKTDENNEKENFENSIKVNLNDSKLVNSNIEEKSDEVEEKDQKQDQDKDIGEIGD